MPAPAQPQHETPRPLPDDCVELHAMDFALHAKDGKLTAPEWVHVAPAGELNAEARRIVRGRDGREFELTDPATVLAGTELPAQFDWEHQSMFFFGSTRAAGWIDRLEWVDEKDVDEKRNAAGWWGHVERWTPDGRADIENGYYRGLSPVVRYQRREPERDGDQPPPPLLIGFVNVALTNRPNLRMTLLHSEETKRSRENAEPEAKTMDEQEKALRARLGLPETASHAEVARATIARFDQLVPKADLELALNRANAAEGELKKHRETQHAAEVERVLTEARKGGKIAPASIEHYRSMAATPEGLKAVQALFATLPSIVPDDHRSDDNPPGAKGDKTLSAHEKQIAASMGLSEKEYLEAKAS